jgi:sterol desaturase/sphingolipid hydroxylase (fatty acid hydroxylase superfamily)
MTSFLIFGILGIWERLYPARKREFPQRRRWSSNLLFWIINAAVSIILFESLSWVQSSSGFRLFSWSNTTNSAKDLFFGFLLLDFCRYTFHRVQHAVPFLWWFHGLHHSDPDVDVTTAVRHHPVEHLVGASVLVTTIVLFQVPASVVAIYDFAENVIAAIQHVNTRFPPALERTLRVFFVTNEMHKVHHSISMTDANSNYGAVFSIWDRCFRTFKSSGDTQRLSMVFGVEGLFRKDCIVFGKMMASPLAFRALRRDSLVES